MKIKTRTYPMIVRSAGKAVGRNVTLHPSTENNEIGQSGLYTLVDDIITIVFESENEREAYKNLITYFIDGEV